MEEVEAPLKEPTTPVASAAPTAVIPVVGTPKEEEHESAEAVAGYTLMQKGLFLGVILGCVAIYVRVNNRTTIKYKSIV